jgi:long-chain fatty acid transport protein
MKLITVIALIILLLPSFSAAGGPVHGSKAVGMGTAFVAVADDPSAILHNPAGLTQLKGTMIYGGNAFVIPSTSFTSTTGDTEGTDFQVFFPPHLYITSDFGMEKAVFGLGVYAPFGIGGRKWSDTGLTRYISVEGFTGTVSLNPTIAVEISPGLSVAAGIDYMGALSKAEVMLNQSSLGHSDARQEMEALGFGWGYNLGLLYFLNEKVSLGFAYRSEIKVDQSGDTTINNIAPALQPLFGGSSFETDLDTTSVFPRIISFGMAYRPSESLTVAIDAEWVGWSSFDETVFDYENEVPAAMFTDRTIPLDWNDSWIIKAGTDYRINEKYSLRAGYAFVETPVPDSTLTPGNPDSDQHNFSIGFGYSKESWTYDLFYNAAFYEDRSVNNSIFSGKYENFAHYTGFSVGKRF